MTTRLHEQKLMCLDQYKLNCVMSWNKQWFSHEYLHNLCSSFQGDQWLWNLYFILIKQWLVHYNLKKWSHFLFKTVHEVELKDHKLEKVFLKAEITNTFIRINLDDVRCPKSKTDKPNKYKVPKEIDTQVLNWTLFE